MYFGERDLPKSKEFQTAESIVRSALTGERTDFRISYEGLYTLEDGMGTPREEGGVLSLFIQKNQIEIGDTFG